MKRYDSVLLRVFLWGIPAIAILAFLAGYGDWTSADPAGWQHLLNKGFGIILALWMGLALFLSLRLILSESLRDAVLARLTFIRERDERETILTGRATKATFLMSLAVLILLFGLSVIQVSVYRVPPDRAIHGKTGMVTLGVGFNLFDQAERKIPGAVVPRRDIFSYAGLPLSSSALILILIAGQILFYNISVRRLIR